MPIRTLSMEEALLRPRREMYKERTITPEGDGHNDGVWVCAEDDEVAGTAFREWLGYLEAGRLGKAGS